MFKQIYSKFITESLLYRTSIGQADYFVSFIPEGESYSISIPVKEAIGLVWYATLREAGWITKDDDITFNSAYHLTVPYKERFDSIEDVFKWNNQKFKNTDILRIVPIKFVIESEDLPEYICGEYTIVDSSVPHNEWEWTNSSKSVVIGFYADDNSGSWKIKTQSLILESDVTESYSDWSYKNIIWKQGTSTYNSYLKLIDYEYLIDSLMPNYNTLNYDELINLLHEQTLGYIQIYQELHRSDWSKQHTGVTDIVKNRSVNAVVRFNVFEGEDPETGEFKVFSIKQYLNLNSDIKEIVDKIEGNTELVARTEYAKLSNSIVRVLFPLDTEYLEDNSGVSLNRFNRLKELFINLCSYNVAFLEGSIGASDTTLTLCDFITQDYDYNETLMTTKSFVNLEELSLDHVYSFKEQMHVVPIYSTILVNPPATPIYISDTEGDLYDNTKMFTDVVYKYGITSCSHYDITLTTSEPIVKIKEDN